VNGSGKAREQEFGIEAKLGLKRKRMSQKCAEAKKQQKNQKKIVELNGYSTGCSHTGEPGKFQKKNFWIKFQRRNIQALSAIESSELTGMAGRKDGGEWEIRHTILRNEKIIQKGQH